MRNGRVPNATGNKLNLFEMLRTEWTNSERTSKPLETKSQTKLINRNIQLT